MNYSETDPSIARSGLLAVQIHAGGPMEVQFKDMMIQPLPTPTADNPTQPGFHLRTVKTEEGERKYTVYVPEGYDGSKVVPGDPVPARRGRARRGRDRAGTGGDRSGDPEPAGRRAGPRRLPAGASGPGRPARPTATPRWRPSTT